MKIESAVFSGSCGSLEGRPSRRAAEFAFIGRSNVGKSSLINMLCGRKELARTSSNPGKTVSLNHFLINDSWYLVDLPGYGFAKLSKSERVRMQRMVQDYVGKSDELKMLFILIDSRHDLQKIDGEFISAVHSADVPYAVVFTKCDKMGSASFRKQIDGTEGQIKSLLGSLPVIFETSSETGMGREDILDFIGENI